MCCKYLWWLYSYQLLSPPPPPPVVAISSFTLPPHHHIYALVSSSCMVNAVGQRESTNRQKCVGQKTSVTMNLIWSHILFWGIGFPLFWPGLGISHFLYRIWISSLDLPWLPLSAPFECMQRGKFPFCFSQLFVLMLWLRCSSVCSRPSSWQLLLQILLEEDSDTSAQRLQTLYQVSLISYFTPVCSFFTEKRQGQLKGNCRTTISS